jgi:hypothetical protein
MAAAGQGNPAASHGVAGSNPATPTRFLEPPVADAASYAERNSPVIISRRRFTPVLQPKSEPKSFGLATRILRRATRADKAVAAVNAGGGASGESASGVSMSVILLHATDDRRRRQIATRTGTSR